MDILKEIEEDKKERDECIWRLRNAFAPRKKKLRTLTEVREILKQELSSIRVYYINYNNKAELQYIDSDKFYSAFVVRIYFPKHNLCVCCSRLFASSLYYTNNILNSSFSEKEIRFKYYSTKTKRICRGPIIMILMCDPKSLLLQNNKNLEEFLKNK